MHDVIPVQMAFHVVARDPGEPGVDHIRERQLRRALKRRASALKLKSVELRVGLVDPQEIEVRVVAPEGASQHLVRAVEELIRARALAGAAQVIRAVLERKRGAEGVLS